MRLPRLLAPIVLSGSVLTGAAFVATAPTALSGCGASASLPAVAPTVATIESDATAVLALITTAVNTYFTISPDSALKSQIVAQIQVAQTALIIGAQSFNGIVNASQGDMVAAFANFESAYSKLVGLLAQIGIVPAPAVVVADGGSHDSGVATVDGGLSAKWKGPQPYFVFPAPVVIKVMGGLH